MKHWAEVLLFKEKINYKTTKNTNLTRIFFFTILADTTPTKHNLT